MIAGRCVEREASARHAVELFRLRQPEGSTVCCGRLRVFIMLSNPNGQTRRPPVSGRTSIQPAKSTSSVPHIASADIGPVDDQPARPRDMIRMRIAPCLRASEAGTYVFVIARSSNPEGAAMQGHGTPPLWRAVAEGIAAMEADYAPGFPGAVIGATDPADLGLAVSLMPGARFLVPGLGAQSGRMEELDALPAEVRERLVVSSSRAIAGRGPDADRLLGR